VEQQIPRHEGDPPLPVTQRTPSWHWLPIGALVVIVLIIVIAGVPSYGSSVPLPVSDTPVRTTLVPALAPRATQSLAAQTPIATYQQVRTVSATIKKFVLKEGDDVSVEGVVSGTRDPVILSVYSVNDASGIDFNHVLLSSIVTPSDDHTFRFRFLVDTKIFPAGSYVILMKLPTGESTKLQFLVDE
jgi:hypothetical protein